MSSYVPNLEEFELNRYKIEFDRVYEIFKEGGDTKTLTEKRLAILNVALKTGRAYQNKLADSSGRKVDSERQRVRSMMAELTTIRTDPDLKIIPDPDLEERL